MKNFFQSLFRKKKKWQYPEYILLSVILLAILSLLIFYFVDLRNLWGLRDALINTKPDYFFFTYRPFFFQHWGRNSGFVELIQWSILGASALLAAFLSGRELLKNKKLSIFWLLLGISFILMLIEDAGDIRHTLMSYVQAITNEPDQGIFGTLFEFLYFAVLGGLPLFALVRYWSELKGFNRVKKYLVIGFIFYALASGLSFIGTAFEGMMDKNIYDIFGERFHNFCLQLGDAELPSFWQDCNERSSNFQIGFFLLDSLIEENLELIGAGAILAGIGSFIINTRNKKEKDE